MAIIDSKTLIATLFLFIIYLKPGSASLNCWKCDPCPEPHDNTSSQVTVEPCTTSQTACVKNSVRVLNKSPQIAKGCVTSCTASSSNFFGQGAFVDCCNTDYCNVSARNQLSSSIYICCTIIFFYIFYHRQYILT